MATKITGAASEAHAAQMRLLGEFCGATEVQYFDHGNGEDYLLIKPGCAGMLTIKARGNRVDGGFLTVELVRQ